MPSMSYEASVIVKAPVEEVYNYLTDFPRHVEWNHQPQKMVSLTDGPARVGSQYQTFEDPPSNAPLSQKVMFNVMMPIFKWKYGASDFTVAEITALEPNQRIAWKAKLPSTKQDDLMRMNWELRTQSNNGGTEIIQHCEVAPPDDSPFAGMFNDDMLARSKAETSANLQRLKAILEGQHSA